MIGLVGGDDDRMIGGIIDRALDLNLVIPRARMMMMIVETRVFQFVHDQLDVSHGEFWF